MKTLGFVISEKENERRRAISFEGLSKIKNKNLVYFETGYGEILGFSDDDIVKQGFNVASRKEVLSCDIICDPKIGDADYISELKNQTLFGWIHATQNKDITDKIIAGKNTAIAWESFFEGFRHSFYKNNEIAGEAAVLDSIIHYGALPVQRQVAILGNGNIARGAYRILSLFGADITVYTSKMEDLFKKEMYNYDILVNAILWDPSRTDHIIYKKDLKKLKSNAMIIDVSCDRAGGVESSMPTTIENPTYTIDGVLHYVVDHTPSLLFKDATESISKEVVKYVDLLIEGKEQENKTLFKSIIIKSGKIIDEEINIVQNR